LTAEIKYNIVLLDNRSRELSTHPLQPTVCYFMARSNILSR